MVVLSATPSTWVSLASPPTTTNSVQFLLSNASKFKFSQKQKKRFGCMRVKASSSSQVLERPPAFDQSQFDPSSQVLEGGDIGRLKDKKGTGSGDSYRVLLVDDARHSETLVAKVLPQAVPSVTPDNAAKLFHESRENGVAVVIVTVKEHAEFYAQMMMRGGLRSTIEPDSDTV